jgi:hypothetical protein
LQCPGKLAVEALDIIGMLQHGELSTGVIVDRKIMATAAMALNFLCGSMHRTSSPLRVPVVYW